jgi:hypothetical protein
LIPLTPPFFFHFTLPLRRPLKEGTTASNVLRENLILALYLYRKTPKG